MLTIAGQNLIYDLAHKRAVDGRVLEVGKTPVPVGVPDQADSLDLVPAHIVSKLAPEGARAVEPLLRVNLKLPRFAQGVYGCAVGLLPRPVAPTLALPASPSGDIDPEQDVVRSSIMGDDGPHDRVVIAQIQGHRQLGALVVQNLARRL